MSWMAKCMKLMKRAWHWTSDDEKLIPISHTLQNAHINIVIDGNGNFKRHRY